MEKSANVAYVDAGQSFTWQIKVTNNGGFELQGQVTDSYCDIEGDASFDLDPQDSETFTCDDTATSDPEVSTEQNTACASGSAEGGAAAVACDDAEVPVYHPGLHVAKEVNATAAGPNATLEYDVTVSNTGDVALQTYPVDDGCENSDAAPALLQPGDDLTFSCTHGYGSDGEPYTNEACADGYVVQPIIQIEAAIDSIKAADVHECGDVTTDLAAIHVVKTGPDYVHEGDDLPYTIHVTNPSTGPLSDIQVDDDLCSDNETDVSGPFKADDDNGDDNLDPGEDWTYYCTVPLPGDRNGNTVTNNVTVTGTPVAGDDVTDSDSWDTTVAHPSFTFEKSAQGGPAFAGEDFSWALLLRNTGDAPLTVDITDAGCTGNLTDITLPPNQNYPTIVYCKTSTPDDTSTSMDNTACAVASDPTVGREGAISCSVDPGCSDQVREDGQQQNIGLIQHCDSATVDIVHPNMTLTKTSEPATADAYDTLNYTITIMNTGDIGLTIFPRDNGCDGFDPSANSLSQIPYIDPGETLTLHCTHFFDPNEDGDSYTNNACALGFPFNFNQEGVVSAQELPACSPGEDCAKLSLPGVITKCASVTTTLAKHQASGQVFEDMNADGAKQDGEPPYPGVVVYADLNNNGARDPGEPNTTTGSDGKWVLPVDFGQTVIREEVPNTATCSFPATCSYTTDLKANEAPQEQPSSKRGVSSRAVDPVNLDFGDWRPASVSGTVAFDANNNWAIDAAEGVGAIPVYADLNGNSAPDSGEPTTTTAGDGSYTIAGLKPGGYVIRHVFRNDGSSCVSPEGCNYNLTLVSHAAEVSKNFLDAKPAPPPEQLVLPSRVIPGVARLTGKTGCVSTKGFYARIRGQKMQRVIFFLDGQSVKSVALPKDNKTYRYRVNVSKLRIGRHSLAVKVTFTSKSHTKNKTLRMTFQRCGAQLRAPAFTG